MENQNHLLETIGPMYVAEVQKKQQEQQTATATTVQTEEAPAIAKKARASKK
jgi:hypothetical protein